MHNGHINVDNHKMSKSAGNFFTVRDIVKEFDPEAVRLFMLSAHYRSPINFSRDLIEQAQTRSPRLYTARDNALFLREKRARLPDDGGGGSLRGARGSGDFRFQRSDGRRPQHRGRAGRDF